MDNIMQMIQEGIRDIFPEIGDLTITSETQLKEIPEWDSIAAVNLQTFLESAFPAKLPLDLFNDETTIGEIVKFIQKKVS